MTLDEDRNGVLNVYANISYLVDQQLAQISFLTIVVQKQSFRDVHKNRCSENVQQIYRRTHILTCEFNKVSKQL